MDNYRYGLTSALELLLLVGQYYFSSVIHFTSMKFVSVVCIMYTRQTDIISESFKVISTLFLSLWLFYENILKMVFKCSVVGCFTNYDGYDRGAVFSLPEEEEQKKQWIKFLNRKDISSINRVKICHKHFEDNLLKKGPKRTKLLYECKPVPTIISKIEVSYFKFVDV